MSKQITFDDEDLKIGKYLGAGRHGIVFDCTYKDEDFVIKLFCSENRDELDTFNTLNNMLLNDKYFPFITRLKYYGYKNIQNTDKSYLEYSKYVQKDENQFKYDCSTYKVLYFLIMDKVDICFYEYMRKGGYFSSINIFELYFGIYNILNNNVYPVDLHGDNICFKILDKDRIYTFMEKQIIIGKNELGLKLVDFGMYIKKDMPEAITGNDIYSVLFIIFNYIYKEYNNTNVDSELIDYLRSKKARELLAIDNIKYMFDKYGKKIPDDFKNVNNSNSKLVDNFSAVTYNDENRKKELTYSSHNVCGITSFEIENWEDVIIPSSFLDDFNKIYPVINCGSKDQHFYEAIYYWNKMSPEEKAPYEEIQKKQDEEREKLKIEASKNFILKNKNKDPEGEELLEKLLNSTIDYSSINIYPHVIDQFKKILSKETVLRDFILKTSRKEKEQIFTEMNKKQPLEYEFGKTYENMDRYERYKNIENIKFVKDILPDLERADFKFILLNIAKILNYYANKMNSFEKEEYKI